MTVHQHLEAAAAAFAVTCACVLASCSKPADSSVCSATNQAIDDDIAAFALTDVEGKAGDTSAIQQGARATQNLTHLLAIDANLSVLTQNGCPPRTSPIRPSSYVSAASDCYKATLAATSAGYGDNERDKTAAAGRMKSACEFSRWKEDGAGPR